MVAVRALAAALLVAGAAAGEPAAFCAGSPSQRCRMECPALVCPAGSCAMRRGDCCVLTCQEAGVGVVQSEMLGEVAPANADVGATFPEEEPEAGAQGPPPPADEDNMPGTLRGFTARSAQSESRSASLCADSPEQLCSQLCPPKRCPAGKCALRVGSCCDFTCKATS